MPQHADEHTGARLARYRKQRGLTQQGLAMRAHISKSLLSKVEAGHKPASPALIAACARALSVTTSDLLGQPYVEELRRDRMDDLVQPIRIGMENWDVPLDWDTPPRPVPLIRADIQRALDQRREADYVPMARDLPALIDETVHAVHTTDGEARRLAHECLAGAFRCVFTLAWSFGYIDLATVALDRIAICAPPADEPGLAAIHAYLRAQTVLSSGRYDVGLRVVDRALRELDGQDARRPQSIDALRGSLHLRAAVLSGRAKDQDSAQARLAEAAAIAERTGELPDYGLTWGTPNVGVHAVAIASELEQWDQAIRLAENVRIPAGWSRSRSGHHWMDLGRVHAWAGHPDKALACLLRARKIAPQQTRYHPTVRETVLMLKRRERIRSSSLAHYAEWVGV
ncbi:MULTISPECIES: helix-turn-helix domain-containing protein [Streptomycetaceae]|uniref:XRE family transcriptional regulator n=1 Tax=Streptantibioticus cattleyicolor (strain ATCC 35852 / DSM 46488 / JCM 4925 / NBRC 14057 / NRRL 8057) TaxID=1003195 RepID=F8K0L2_STREN|nr:MULTISPECIES: helix-turn-helix transcriptional regulator [Streptomycetaceae]AEW97418.1 XRE family transcriptional regulator [Streptantibioticus cattleyicolor NRRL 8057 = DSM 46488]MYS61861.1 helix-turn-helix domain-containing protein [Streptomyces sp. SID5468]CCB77741.1 Transcriptional regulator, XRE family [Streptantibioticus cattleyicolor NRRL 8057 = DSM 46488]